MSCDIIIDVISIYRIMDQVKGKRYDLSIRIQWTGRNLQALQCSYNNLLAKLFECLFSRVAVLFTICLINSHSCYNCVIAFQWHEHNYKESSESDDASDHSSVRRLYINSKNCLQIRELRR